MVIEGVLKIVQNAFSCVAYYEGLVFVNPTMDVHCIFNIFSLSLQCRVITLTLTKYEGYVICVMDLFYGIFLKLFLRHKYFSIFFKYLINEGVLKIVQP
jgi:hypothetical protein